MPDAGGYLGSAYFKITIAGTDRTLAATSDSELVVLPAFTGEPEQLWRIDQLTDGSWRIMPKSLATGRSVRRREQFRQSIHVRSQQRQAALVTKYAVTRFNPDRNTREGRELPLKLFI